MYNGSMGNFLQRHKAVLDQVRLVRASAETLTGAAADRERTLRLCNGIEAWLQSRESRACTGIFGFELPIASRRRRRTRRFDRGW